MIHPLLREIRLFFLAKPRSETIAYQSFSSQDTCSNKDYSSAIPGGVEAGQNRRAWRKP